MPASGLARQGRQRVCGCHRPPPAPASALTVSGCAGRVGGPRCVVLTLGHSSDTAFQGPVSAHGYTGALGLQPTDPAMNSMVRSLRTAALGLLSNGVNIPRELIQVREVVTGQHSQHHAQGLRAALIVLAGALQIRR